MPDTEYLEHYVETAKKEGAATTTSVLIVSQYDTDDGARYIDEAGQHYRMSEKDHTIWLACKPGTPVPVIPAPTEEEA